MTDMASFRGRRGIRIARLLVGLGMLILISVGPMALASVGSSPDWSSSAASAQADEEFPYQPPEFAEVDPPWWAGRFEIFARLPLWAQAAFLSAGLAGLVFVAPMMGRWLWNLGSESQFGSGP